MQLLDEDRRRRLQIETMTPIAKKLAKVSSSTRRGHPAVKLARILSRTFRDDPRLHRSILSLDRWLAPEDFELPFLLEKCPDRDLCDCSGLSISDLHEAVYITPSQDEHVHPVDVELAEERRKRTGRILAVWSIEYPEKFKRLKALTKETVQGAIKSMLEFAEIRKKLDAFESKHFKASEGL